MQQQGHLKLCFFHYWNHNYSVSPFIFSFTWSSAATGFASKIQKGTYCWSDFITSISVPSSEAWRDNCRVRDTWNWSKRIGEETLPSAFDHRDNRPVPCGLCYASVLGKHTLHPLCGFLMIAWSRACPIYHFRLQGWKARQDPFGLPLWPCPPVWVGGCPGWSCLPHVRAPIKHIYGKNWGHFWPGCSNQLKLLT